MSTDLAQIPEGYYAVSDPDRPERITYWRMSRRGSTTKFGPWPVKARYGPQLAAADLPADPAARDQAIDTYRAERARYTDAVLAAVAADPVTAGRRFAAFGTRCWVCARPLTDDYSKVIGIGPDCRAGLPAAALAARGVPAVGRAHAAHLETNGEDTARQAAAARRRAESAVSMFGASDPDECC